MSKITGKLGSFGGQDTSKQRTVVVSDESGDDYFNPSSFDQAHVQSHSIDDLDEQEKQDLIAFRQRVVQERKSVAERPTQFQKKRLDALLGIGRVKTTVNVDGSDFTLQSLKNSEFRKCMTAAARTTVIEYDFEFRTQVLAHSLVELDQTPIDYTIEKIDLSESYRLNTSDAKEMAIYEEDPVFAKRLAFLDELGDHVLQILFSGYSKMMSEFNEKYSIKDGNDAKEVSESIKKS